MMEGVFRARLWTAVYNIMALISGVFLMGLFSVLLAGGSEELGGDALLAWFFIGFGFLAAALGGVSLYVNRRAFVRVDDRTIRGYFHFGLSLECGLDDIDAVSYGGTGLNLRLKNGKNYNMHNLENACALGVFIKRRLPLRPLTEKTEAELRQTLNEARSKRKKLALELLFSFVLVFAGIFLTEWLTGGRELRDFLPADWKIFCAMIAADAVLAVMVVILVRRVVRLNEVCQRNLEDLYLLILRTAPLPPGNARKVFISLEDHPPIRVTVCGFPHSDEVYYIIEELGDEQKPETVHESGIYPSLEALGPELEGLREITMETAKNK